jgi:hypothetical protein
VSSGSRDRIASDVCVSEARRSSCPGEARTDAAARNRYRRIGDRQPREARRDNTNAPTSTVSTARCGPACRVVWEGSGHHDRPLSRFMASPLGLEPGTFGFVVGIKNWRFPIIFR